MQQKRRNVVADAARAYQGDALTNFDTVRQYIHIGHHLKPDEGYRRQSKAYV